MKIMIIGGTGTIGQAVAAELGARHEIIIAGSKTGDIQLDITSAASIAQAYQRIHALDAVVMTAGQVHFGELVIMTEGQFYIGIQSKLMGQVNVVLAGLQQVNPHGSFTLTSGILNHDPIQLGASAAMVNGAIEGFVKSAAIELPHHLRINAVSPSILTESMDAYAEYFRGFKPVPAAIVALAYAKSVEGAQTGQVYRVW